MGHALKETPTVLQRSVKMITVLEYLDEGMLSTVLV